jgi:predicted glycoside hydrolase/deacetylase ChbG (UPF0249 family)
MAEPKDFIDMDKYLIINADDYGISQGVCRGVIEGHLYGIITSTSVMINMPFTEEAIRKVQNEAPDLGIGLHINLTSGYPVLPAADVQSLVTSEGIFRNLFHLAESPPISKHLQSEILAQFNRFAEITGGIPDHLDSHQFVTYILPVAFETMLEIAEKYEIPIRSPAPFLDTRIISDLIDTMAGDMFDDQDIANFIQYLEPNRQVISLSRRTRWPDHFEYHFYGKGSNKENLIRILKNLPPVTTELMCHAGYSKDLDRNEGYGKLRDKELSILMDPEIKEIVRSERINLVNFSCFRKH